MPASVTADPAEARAPEPADRGRLRWWKEVLFGAAVYAIYSAVRNQFGSAGGDPGPAFEHARQLIRLEEAIGLYVEPSIQSWYLDLPADGLLRAWNVFSGIAHLDRQGGGQGRRVSVSVDLGGRRSTQKQKHSMQ